ncbi:hypothetical protein NH8B_2119 [Pseudogulbenkiania sp. NH8B]|uniref:hypothetical protein n=1 Tax=Pseudogulbenkiania sp. (strain NH8B) TaxID=748280 RepID=UPI0002279BBB|nr:hypothetical protein [Pseudogulbenkiania sp. NH8B]BAK76505.1 hypothetical protein NH8B_1688 [Pseudogulbenkiania sp. NH8B]BAK76934.1 hypothetical protein NH8B_2119 [Pseudogulbenkiania sp. NH8B]
MISFALYYDAALTRPVTELALTGDSEGMGTPPRMRLWAGPTPGRVATAADGGDIVLSAQSTGAGIQANAVRLATSEDGLATGGASVSLGARIDVAVPVWLQITTQGIAVGDYRNLELVTNALKEAAL